MIRRREFIAGLGSAAAWPVVVRAQQPAVIGVLGIATAEGYALNIAAFMQGVIPLPELFESGSLR
jgi:hypothetical protein